MAFRHFANQTMSHVCPQLTVLLTGWLSPQHCLRTGYLLIPALDWTLVLWMLQATLRCQTPEALL